MYEIIDRESRTLANKYRARVAINGQTVAFKFQTDAVSRRGSAGARPRATTPRCKSRWQRRLRQMPLPTRSDVLTL
jgi:hypothetical protein